VNSVSHGLFARSRLRALLFSQALGALGALVVSISDKVVSGNFVGIDALAGIAAVAPVVVGAQFLAKLVYCGAGYVFALRLGAFDRVRAREAVGLSLEMAVVVGLFTYGILFFGRDLYLDLMGLAGSVRVQAICYWRWMAVFLAVNPLTMTMWRLVYADGETVTTAVADLLSPPLTVFLSILFTRQTGTAAGAGLGLFVACTSTDLVMMLHVFRKSNAVIPKWCFSFAGVRELISCSMTDAVTKLCQCGRLAVVNMLVVRLASPRFLPVVGVITLIDDLREILDRVGDGYMPIAGMYIGEGNVVQAARLARRSAVVAVLAGFLAMGVIILFAPQIVAFYGIGPGEIFDTSAWALLVCSFVLPVAALLAFVCSHYLVVGHVRLAAVETVLEEFLLTALAAAGLGFVFGFRGIWIGIPLGAVLTLGIVYVYGRVAAHGGSSLLIPSAEGREHIDFSLTPTEGAIVSVRDRVGDVLRERGVCEKTVTRVMLLVEELVMSVADTNARRFRRVVAEVSLVIDAETVRIIFRDTGRIRDAVDPDAQVSGLRSFVLSGLLQLCEKRHYLAAVGCNRSVLSFPRK